MQPTDQQLAEAQRIIEDRCHHLGLDPSTVPAKTMREAAELLAEALTTMH